eukprot:3970864-Prymnesium_polylepis.1
MCVLRETWRGDNVSSAARHLGSAAVLDQPTSARGVGPHESSAEHARRRRNALHGRGRRRQPRHPRERAPEQQSLAPCTTAETEACVPFTFFFVIVGVPSPLTTPVRTVFAAQQPRSAREEVDGRLDAGEPLVWQAPLPRRGGADHADEGDVEALARVGALRDAPPRNRQDEPA